MRLASRRHGHDQHLGRIEHALDLELHEVFFTFAQGMGGAHALLLDQPWICRRSSALLTRIKRQAA
jgi:hypothetical protein